MDTRISIIGLGVADLSRARAFYVEGLGWPELPASNDRISFIRLNGVVLSLYGWDALAEDVGCSPEGSGFRGVTIAHNVASEAEVDAVLEKVAALGATVVKEAQKVFWGGYSGYFRDPDDHLWEVAHNPYWDVAKDG